MEVPISVSCAIVAGGSSRRMGRDKRLLDIDGIPLLRRVIDVAAPLVDDLHVVVADGHDRERVAHLAADVAVDLDLRPGEGPLAGIETALTTARHDLVLVLATDHPRLSPAVLRLLIDRLAADTDRLAVAVVTDRGPQPLLAAYRRGAIDRVTALLDRGERRATALIDDLDPLRLEPDVWLAEDPSGASAQDLDSPEDLEAMELRRRERVAQLPVVRVRRGRVEERQDHLVDEEPLEIRACGPGQEPRTVVTTMRTRGNDEDLAVGWLHSEGLLRSGGVVDITTGDPLRHSRPDDQLTVHLDHPLDTDALVHRHAVATASCGVCGRASIDELAARVAPVPLEAPASGSIPWELLAALPDRLRDAQELFATTGAIHATGLFEASGRLVTLREDVGRHNALDAAIGAHVRAGSLPLHHLIGVLSGRVGFELVAKAAAAGLPLLAAVGAPTDLAVRTAERFGITLVGFLRRGDGNVYTRADRIAHPQPSAGPAPS